MWSETVKLFQEGKTIDKILYLDNFYQNIDISKISEKEFLTLFANIIENESNNYIRRSSFKILCELNVICDFRNRFKTISYLHDFLVEDEFLQIIALKYVPFFHELHNSVKDQLVELSDSSNADVSSQAYFCLGIINLASVFSDTSPMTLVTKTKESRQYFKAAIESIENREDAEFYLLLLDLIEILILHNENEFDIAFIQLENKLKIRNLYEFEFRGLELDFQIFQIMQQINIAYKTALTSNKWYDVLPKIETLFKAHTEILKIRSNISVNNKYANILFDNVFKTVEAHIYSSNLFSEKQRLNSLSDNISDAYLIEFIETIISSFSNIKDKRVNDLELLAILSDSIGKEQGLNVYEKIQRKEITIYQAISNLLKSSNNNQSTFKTGSIQGRDILCSLMMQIDNFLPDYPIDKRELFQNLLEELIRYARTTFVGHEKKSFQFLYSKSEKIAGKPGLGQDAKENDLQESMMSYFEHSKIADGLDHEKSKFVDGGRVDIVYKRDIITIPIELKKSIVRPDKNTLEANYIAQAQTYTAGYDQLGIFVLLELSDKTLEAPPSFKDWFNIHHLLPSTNQNINYPDYVISLIIPGNKTTPSKKSKYN